MLLHLAVCSQAEKNFYSGLQKRAKRLEIQEQQRISKQRQKQVATEAKRAEKAQAEVERRIESLVCRSVVSLNNEQ